MRDARYMRAPAELCLDIARQMSDVRAAEELRGDAARCHAGAVELEGAQPPAMTMPRKAE